MFELHGIWQKSIWDKFLIVDTIQFIIDINVSDTTVICIIWFKFVYSWIENFTTLTALISLSREWKDRENRENGENGRERKREKGKK